MTSSYRGWRIRYFPNNPETGKYVADSFGVEMNAASRVAIERMVDQRLLDYPPNGHGGPRDTQPYYTVGYWDETIKDWYFNGEFEQYDTATSVAQKTATAKGSRSRVTNHVTGKVEYFDPQ